MYSYGRGVPPDQGQAVGWYVLAAEKRADFQLLLGEMYRSGDGVPHDYVEAARWFREAAEQGNVAAQYFLGLANYNGDGVRKDFVRAHKWFNLAASRAGGDGMDDLAKRRDEVAGKMTLQQITEAQRLAREWKPKAWDELKGRLDESR